MRGVRATFAQKMKVLVAVALSVGVAGTQLRQAEAAPVPGARTALERVTREWQELGRRQTEAMVKARLELAEYEEQLRIGEQKLTALRGTLTRLREQIETVKEKSAGGQVPPNLKESEQNLRAKEQTFRADVLLARKKFITSEEGLRLLEREQTLQRDRARARLDAAEDRLRQEEGGPQSKPTGVDRRLREVERELDKLRRVVHDLRRQLQLQRPTEGGPASPRP